MTTLLPLVSAALVVAGAAQWHRPRRRPGRPPATPGGVLVHPRHLRPDAIDRGRRPTSVVIGAVGVLGLVAVATGLTVPAMAVAATVVVRRALHHRAHSRRAAAEAAACVPDVVELVLVAVHAGMTPAQAVLGLRPFVDAAMVPVVDEIERRVGTGERLADALSAFTELGGEAFRPFVGTLALVERTGDPLGPVLDRLADEARRDRRRLADVSARELPVRLTVPLVCCTLPAFLLLTIAPVLAGALSSLRHSAP